MNVDASFLLRSDEGATCLFLRDYTCALIRGQAIWYVRAANALITEAFAARDGVKFGCDLGIRNIIFDMDAIELVKLWRARMDGTSEITSILHDIEELSNNLASFQLNFVGHESNIGAHLCAKQASVSRRRCLWISYVPSF